MENKASVKSDECIGCGVCEAACPAGAIKMNEKAEIDAEACTGCGACLEVCPVDAIGIS